MKITYVPLFSSCFLALLFVAYCSSATDSQVLASPVNVVGVKDPAKLNLSHKSGGSESDPDVLHSVQGNKDELDKPIDGVKSDYNKTDSSGQSVSNKGEKVSTEKEKFKGLAIGKEGDNVDHVAAGLKPSEKTKDSDKQEVPVIKETSPPGEECDASNSCNDVESHLVACLRVPGNDSPELSLLIQNKGSAPLTVRISAPDYVHLETRKIQLLQKEDKKVKVSIKQGGAYSLITLKSGGKSNCSLDFKDMVTHNSEKETDTQPNSKYAFLLNHTPYFVIVLFVLLVLVGSTLLCMHFKHKRFPTVDTKYQKLNLELPVTGGSGGKADSDVSDGWDNGWDDNWDDEEAPKTPSMPLTPSLTSKGLAPRRSNKEGWKD